MISSEPTTEPTHVAAPVIRANRPYPPRCDAPLRFACDEYVCFTCRYEYLLDDRELDLLREGREPCRRAATIAGLPLTAGFMTGGALVVAGPIAVGLARIVARRFRPTPMGTWPISLLAWSVLAVLLAVGASCGGDDADVQELEARLAAEGLARLTVSSDAFRSGEQIPIRYTCDGEDVSPPLIIADVPSDAVSLAVITDDPDAPRGTWVHWVTFNMPGLDRIEEGASAAGIEGKNSWGNTGYRGPCPPSGVHRYFFKVYALDSEVSLAQGADKEALLEAMQGHAIAYGELIGVYSRQ